MYWFKKCLKGYNTIKGQCLILPAVLNEKNTHDPRLKIKKENNIDESDKTVLKWNNFLWNEESGKRIFNLNK